ncbi:perilipin 6 [Sphaeramia orbicularis]|uniref:perilipin 6 n=1 Tax=Sphaeramia orbicularis TaxID=375764 RepID=UPI00117E6DF7|nr:perilipin-3-like [Sphaeramia orbicularis]
MGFGKREMSDYQNHEMSAMLRVSRLPLVRSALQSMTSAYSDVKGRYPLLGLVGGVAEVGVRSVSQIAMTRATPLLQSLEPQIEVANSFAMDGLDRLEKNFPILHQSTDEVVGHLKDAFLLTLDDVQMWVVDNMDGVVDQLERLSDSGWAALRVLQDTQVGRVAASGLDDVLSRLEDATAYYLPLPPTLRREWEARVQQYEEEDDDDEPSLWTRIRSLMLNIGLQIYHRMLKVRDQLGGGVRALRSAANTVGLGQVMELLNDLLLSLQSLLVALLYRTENLREVGLNRVRSQAVLLAELPPIRQVLELPIQMQQLLGDLQELSKLLVQLIINATPLYNMLQQPSQQELEDFLNQHDFTNSSSRRNSSNSLFLKAMDGRPRRRRSLYSLASRAPQGSDGSSGRRSSIKRDSVDNDTLSTLSLPSEGLVQRRPSATELLLAPLKQFVTQSQKAFEYLTPNSPEDPNSTADNS